MDERGEAEPSEREEAMGRLKGRVEELLRDERELLGVFECLCAGVKSPMEIGRRLGLDEQAVKNARKRLERRLAREAGKVSH